jgi:sugar phosphate isomerase/epimerase
MIRIGYKPVGLKISIAEKIAFAKEIGLTDVEVNSNDLSNDNDVAQWMEASAKHGIKLKSYAAGSLNISNPIYELTETNAVKNAVKRIQPMGIDMLLSRSLSPINGIPQKETWHYIIRKAREIAVICQDAGIKYALEVDHGCFIHTLERAQVLMHYVNHDNLYLNYDPANMYIGGSDPLYAIAVIKDKIAGGHIKDAIYRSEYIGETSVGYGEIDYAAIFAELNKHNVDVVMHYEHFSHKDEVISAHKHITSVLEGM